MFPSRRIFYFLLFGMLAIGIWVNYGTLDIVTSAECVVVPSKKIQKIRKYLSNWEWRKRKFFGLGNSKK